MLSRKGILTPKAPAFVPLLIGPFPSRHLIETDTFPSHVLQDHRLAGSHAPPKKTMATHPRYSSRKSPGQAPSPASRFLEHRLDQLFSSSTSTSLVLSAPCAPMRLPPYPLDIITGISWHFVPVTDVDALFLEILRDQLSSHPPRRRRRYPLTHWRHGRVLLLHRASLAVRASNDRRRPGLASTSSARSVARPAHSEPRRSRPRHLSDLGVLPLAHGTAYARFPRAD